MKLIHGHWTVAYRLAPLSPLGTSPRPKPLPFLRPLQGAPGFPPALGKGVDLMETRKYFPEKVVLPEFLVFLFNMEVNLL